MLIFSTFFLTKNIQSEQKWKLLAEVATKKCEFELAQECLHKAEDFGSKNRFTQNSGLNKNKNVNQTKFTCKKMFFKAWCC